MCMIQSVSWTGWMTISSCKIPETAGAYIRTAGCPNQLRPGLGRCDLVALLLANRFLRRVSSSARRYLSGMPLIILTVVGRAPPWLGHLCRLSPIAAFALRNFTARCFGWILPRRCLCLLPRHGFRTAAASVSRRFNPTLHTILHTSDTYDTIDTCIYYIYIHIWYDYRDI